MPDAQKQWPNLLDFAFFEQPRESIQKALMLLKRGHGIRGQQV
jgi:hypothetical protein